MAAIENTKNTPLVRINFSNDDAWRALLTEVQRPSNDGFIAHVDVIDDAMLGSDASQLVEKAAKNNYIALCVFADTVTMTHPDHPLLCIDLESRIELRVVPSQLWAIENNLSIANMGIEEFVDLADPDGILRSLQ